jgi:hypothetical protein
MRWTITVLVAVVAVLATLLAVGYFRSEPRIAWGQVGEGVSANYVIALLSAPPSQAGDRMPLVIVDTKAQTVMVYEYVISNRRLLLRCARSFTNDRELEDYISTSTDMYYGPSVKDTQKIVEDQIKRRATGGGGRY